MSLTAANSMIVAHISSASAQSRGRMLGSKAMRTPASRATTIASVSTMANSSALITTPNTMRIAQKFGRNARSGYAAMWAV